MKPGLLAFALALVLLAGCATTKPNTDSTSTPETVMVTYHVRPGGEVEFAQVLADAWKRYRQNDLVFTRPHIIVRDQETGGNTRFVEIFTWKTHEGPEHAPDSVNDIWKKMTSLCESRNGHRGLEGGEVQIISSAK